MNIKLVGLTSFTMIAFATNSIFCRLALVDPSNSALSFTITRLLSGATILAFFFLRSNAPNKTRINKTNLLAPVLLFSYALFFSLSYVRIDAGIGALILFASVQLTMMTAAYIKGQRLNTSQKFGVTLAISGFVYLLLPGLNMPPMVAAILMIISGISWGCYSVLGQSVENPILATSRNFILTVPLAILLFLVFPFHLNRDGWMWAILSGAVTSGLGYVLWYSVLKELLTSTAAIIQLSVPVIAAIGGVLFLGENISSRLIIAGTLIFAGIVIKVKGSSGV